MRTRKLKGGKYQDDFVRACRLGQLDKVQALITKKVVNPAADDQLSLREAVRFNHEDVVQVLLADPRINPASDFQEIFNLACELRTDERVLRLFFEDPRIDINATFQLGIQFAIMHNRQVAVKMFLSDARFDLSFQNQRAFRFACWKGTPSMLKLFLDNPRINPTADNQRGLHEAIEKGRLENVQFLLQDPRFDPAMNGQEALKKACLSGKADIVKHLLSDPRVDPSVNDQEPLRIARENHHEQVVNILKADPRVQELAKWKGFTRSDITKFDSVFEENANNFSCCPVCLRYVSREDGCMYMNHKCLAEPGANTVHKALYDMYKNDEGSIYWCTICGRICMGHRHYQLGPIDTKAELVPVKPGANPFATDCSLTEGGGGKPEKSQRFHAFRQYAQMLQEEVGKMSHREAIDQLVEAMWTAPLSPMTRRLAAKNMQAKKFAIKNNDFPTTPHVEAPNINRPAQNAALLPTIIESGYNAIAMMDDEKVIQFKHRQRNGLINKHEGEGEQIGTDSFESYIQSNLSDGKAGPCWLPSCTAEIHPDEIRVLVRLGQFSDVLYKRYKEAFNHLHQAGGSKENILQEAKHAECVIFAKTRKTRKSK
jgi:ankyrin repeat protein